MRRFFSLTDTTTTEIYTLSLHDALPISRLAHGVEQLPHRALELTLRSRVEAPAHGRCAQDRKSTRLNSSHVSISYAVFCLKKKRRAALDDDSGREDRHGHEGLARRHHHG